MLNGKPEMIKDFLHSQLKLNWKHKHRASNCSEVEVLEHQSTCIQSWYLF